MSSGGRSRLPTWSARNGGVVRAVMAAGPSLSTATYDSARFRAGPDDAGPAGMTAGGRRGRTLMKRRQLIQRAVALGGAAAAAPLIAACGPAATAPSAS